MTNVFISWSGDLSKQIAEELRKWIPSTLQFAKPYFTPNDVEKGTKWSSEISQQLSDTDVGIICLTRENYEKPWILFEAGALSKDLDNSKVCSILFGMDNTDLSGPLTTFQTTNFEKSDFKKLLATINDAGAEHRLLKETFDDVFEMWWPKLDEKIKAIMANGGANEANELRSERDLLEEILSLSRLSAKKIRGSDANVSPGALIHIIKVATGLLNEAQAHGDRDIVDAISEIADAARHIAVNAGLSGVVAEDLDELASQSKIALARIEKPREIDDEIPF